MDMTLIQLHSPPTLTTYVYLFIKEVTVAM
jgi:hypothetical protein